MDAISYSYADKQAKRIKKFNENPDSASGILTQPSVIQTGETVSIPAGRTAIMANTQINGTVNIDGTMFIPSGATFGDLESQIDLKAPLTSAALVNPTINGVAQSGYSGFKNYVINGNFDIWQRGTATVPALDSETFIADRFYAVISGAAKNLRQITLDANYINKYGLSIDGGVACTSSYISTRLESINTNKLHGKTVTLSCKVFASNASTMTINIDRPISVDTYTSIIPLHSELVTLEAGVNNISFSFTFEEVAPTYGLQIAWLYGALGANDDRVLADIQLEEGSVATPFENRPYGLELSLCQRYYESVMASVNGIAHFINGDYRGPDIAFKVPKRVAPTASPTSIPVNGFALGANGAGINLGGSIEGIACDVNMFTINNIGNYTNLSGAVGGGDFMYSCKAVGYINFNAEL